MDADAALLAALKLGEDKHGWSDAVMEEAERLLPALIKAGYAEVAGNTWNFTPKGAARAMELDQRS